MMPAHDSRSYTFCLLCSLPLPRLHLSDISFTPPIFPLALLTFTIDARDILIFTQSVHFTCLSTTLIISSLFFFPSSSPALPIDDLPATAACLPICLIPFDI